MDEVITNTQPANYTMLRKAYPYAAAYCDYMGSFDYYTHAELQGMADAQAPADALYYDHDAGRWFMIADYPECGQFRQFVAANYPELVQPETGK